MQKTAATQRAEKKESQRKEQEKAEEIKKNNPQAYIQSLYTKRTELLNKIEEVKKKKQELTSRGSTASQHRMQTIAALSIGTDKKGVEDTFGKSDNDWEVYRGISRDALEDEEDEYQQQLAEAEELLIVADSCNLLL
jgi:actin-related protein 5